MQSRNDNPVGFSYNFGTESVFNNIKVVKSSSNPIVSNGFLLLDNSYFLVLDGSNFLLLE